MTGDQRIGAEFAAQILGGELVDGPAPADSMLGWIQASPQVTRDEIRAEWARRGVDLDALARGEFL